MATNQFLMLEEISMEYHAFRKDQLLTHKQLNDLISFFEDQDRLTRTCLVGVGLVCGLAVNYDASQPSISVSKGCAVTTDGDLLVVDATTYRHFKPYDNRKKGTSDPIYDPFFPVPDGGKQIGLWELVVPDSKGELPVDSKLLNTFNAASGKNLEDMVALLYLEYYLQDPDKCTAIDCDNQGPHQIAKIKVLLLTKADMEKVINRDPAQEIIADSIYKKYHNATIEYFGLPLLKAKRVILNASNTSSIAQLAKSYTGIVQADGTKLINAVADLYNAFKFMIDPAQKTNINNLKQALQQALATQPKIYQAQYLYDYYKDIITCYNELRDLLFRCMYECCPDKYAFPKHIMLGELKTSGIEPAPYRHDFYPSPATCDNKDKVAQCRSMWQRMQLLIQQFELEEQPTAIRITPSTDYDRLLEDRAIPFYYKDVKPVAKSWNYKLSRRGAEKSVLSYRSGEYAAGIDSTLNPLDYNIDGNNFFRIEGHLGKQLSQAMAGIDKIKNDKSVPFDLVAVRINKTGNLKDINIDDFDCQFEDLIAILKAWLIEQNCLYGSIARFFSGFSTNKAAGFHVKIDDYKAAPGMSWKKETMKMMKAKRAPGVRITDEDAGMEVIDMRSPKPICKTVYTIDTTIEDNLEDHPDSLGVYFARSMQAGYSADDIIAHVKQQSASDPALATLSAEEREVVYETPIMVVAHTTEISHMKPYQIDEINMEMLERYMQLMERFCAVVKRLRGRLETLFNGREAAGNTTGYNRQGYEGYYLFLIQQLIANCCAAEKLESLLEEINRRKRKILESLLFANYAKQHPGLEHKAGVHRGGTFVLVYAQEGSTRPFREAQIMEIEAAAPGIARSERMLVSPADDDTGMLDYFEGREKKYAVYEDIETFAYYLVTNQGKVDFNEEVERYMKLHRIKEGSLEEQVFNKKLSLLIKAICARLTKEEEATIAANVVIADFTLPYLCCSDCPPMTFIMPKQEFNLSLPKAAACNDEGQLEFRKEPADGVVKAPAGLEATVVNKDGKTFFDPTKVPAASFGKEIRFTINDQLTDCRITVFKHPVAKFSFNVETDNADVVKVVFTNTSDDPTKKEYVYEWNFGDGNPPRKVLTQDPITIIYKKAWLDGQGFNGKIPVTLKATNGPCSDAITIEVPYHKEEQVSLSLPNAILCDDAAPAKFTVQPADGVVASPDVPAAVVKSGTQYQFDPSKVPAAFWNKALAFTVNGRSTTCTIKVYHHPKAAFDAMITAAPAAASRMVVAFTNNTDPANNQQLTYRWKFNDGTDKVTTSTAPFTETFDTEELVRNGQTELIVILLASNPACSDQIEKRFQLPGGQTVVRDCGETVKAAIEADVQSLRDPELTRFLRSIATAPESSAIRAQLKDTLELLNKALAQSANLSQPVVQAELLKATSAQLTVLYNNQFSQDINDNVITPQVRALLKLALNIVKCSATLTGQVKEQLFGILNTFKARTDLRQRIPQLDAGNVMMEFLRGYVTQAAVLADAQVKNGINDFGKDIKEFF